MGKDGPAPSGIVRPILPLRRQRQDVEGEPTVRGQRPPNAPEKFQQPPAINNVLNAVKRAERQRKPVWLGGKRAHVGLQKQRVFSQRGPKASQAPSRAVEHRARQVKAHDRVSRPKQGNHQATGAAGKVKNGTFACVFASFGGKAQIETYVLPPPSVFPVVKCRICEGFYGPSPFCC